jgi:hypothetical protein
MTIEQQFLISTVKASVTGKTVSIEAEPDWLSFYKLADRHALLPLVYDGLKRSTILWQHLPQSIQTGLFSAYMQAIYQDVQTEHLKKLLQTELERAGISHIFLKGAVLKYNYPEPALRTMNDLDILVHVEDFDAIADIVKVLDGKAMPGDGNHRNYCFYDSVFVEFHPNLLHHATPVGTGINPGWQYAKEDSRTCSGALTAEGFYLNTICHLASHFVDGGVGVRYVLDVWVNRHLRKPEADRAFVEAELKRFGLLDFARNIEQLAEAWFGNLPMTPLLEELGEYILTSGLQGTSERAMLNAMSLSSGGSRAAALWKKAFYPKAELEDRFPWCKGKPILLPAAWCARVYYAFTQHGRIVGRWIRGTGQITKNELAEHREKLHRFGIR